MICPGGQILLSRRLPGTGQCLSASPATSLSMLRIVITVMSVIASAQQKKQVYVLVYIADVENG